MGLEDDLPRQLGAVEAMLNQGRFEDARAAYVRLRERYPGHPELYNGEGICLARLGRPEAAHMCFQEALGLRPDYVPALINLGNLLVEDGQPETALAYFRRALARDPDAWRAYQGMAAAWRRLGHPGEAAGNLRQAERLRYRQAGEEDRPPFGQRRGAALWLWGILAAVGWWVVHGIVR